ncbi:MAG: hypothetical protein K0U20_09020 [Proteobacteria bacterium]|nr:hypothetical protein [Pseudomonadota bacterium]
MSEEKENLACDSETAKNEFDRFIDSMDLDLDTADMDVEDLTAFNKQKNRILRAIERGSLVINEDGEACYTPQHSRSKYKDEIVFHERTGASLMAMDGKKKGHDVAKTYAVLADMCRVHPNVFAGLVGTDVKVCEALFALLMD